MFESVINTFNENLEATSCSIEALVPGIVEACGFMVDTFLQEKKVIACANGTSHLIVNHFTTMMLNRYQHERPSLPAISLCNDSGSITSIAKDVGLSEIYSRPIRALGQPGDVLLVATDCAKNKSLIQAIQAGHDREMRIVAITSGDGGDIPSLLLTEDLELRMPTLNKARALELQLLVSNCIADLIDQQLFGG
jgi:D-sedoheptulose 7-phosphate isomerase